MKLAAQLFSTSVADAIAYIRDDIKHLHVRDASPTIECIRNIDACFDILNIRSPRGKYQKAPLSKTNEVIFL